MWKSGRSGLILLVLSAAAFAPTSSLAENYALIVGVNNCPRFNQPFPRGPRPLRGAEEDAEMIAGLLKAEFGFPADNVAVLKGPKANRKSIEAMFERFARTLTTDDQFLFHFSGHGTQCRDEDPRDELQDELDEALCPYDAIAGKRGTLIVDDQLAGWIDKLRAGRITVILDCCHSGTGIKGERDEPKRGLLVRSLQSSGSDAKVPDAEKHWAELATIAKAPHRRVVAAYACGSRQLAYEGPHYGMKRKTGLFSRYLVESLTDGKHKADADGNEEISVGEMVEYAGRRIREEFRAKQVPAAEAARRSWALIEK